MAPEGSELDFINVNGEMKMEETCIDAGAPKLFPQNRFNDVYAGIGKVSQSMAAFGNLQQALTDEQLKQLEEEKLKAHEENKRRESFRGEAEMLVQLVRQGKTVGEAAIIIREILEWGAAREKELGI